MAGKFVLAAARASGSRLLPVDSEHNAVFQCLEGQRVDDVRRIVLTASGGAFRDWPLEKLVSATPADALKHPNWAMGPKITVDSATLANKGLELIEAQWLFGLRPEQCQTVLHAQSIVHCLVEFRDGSMLTQLCPPSMTFPIQHALFYPERAHCPTDDALKLDRSFALDFRPVDAARYPLLGVAQAAMAAGGTAPAVFNAANEVAVAAFLQHEVRFLALSGIVEQTLAQVKIFEPATLDEVIAADAEARRTAHRLAAAARSA
jgi:1-deoxy-D-xylulose-5-phosphate reductoisomerase